MPGILQDLRFAVRVLARSLGYTLTAALTLAVGIGATTSIFTIVSGVLLEPLPYPDPDRLVIVRADTKGATRALLSSPEVDELRRSGLFLDVGSMNIVDGSLTGDTDMETVTAASATERFLPVLGVVPALGRHFVLHEDMGQTTVTGVIISFELWQRHYGGAPNIVGSHIDVNNLSVTVVGVLPRGFRVHLDPGLDTPARIDLWFPRGLDGGPTDRSEITVARLPRGVTREQAQASLDGLAVRLVDQYPAAYADRRLTLHAAPLQDDLVRTVRPALVALMAGVALLLLISCANVAHLTLARGSTRARELAVRQALGAEPRRLAQHLIVESLVLGAVAGVLGLLVAYWGVAVLRGVAGTYLPRVDQIAIDLPVLLFNAAVSVLAVVIFGLAPAVMASRRDLLHGLRAGAASGGAAPGEGRLRTLLLISQVALLFVLLVAGGLVLRTVSRLQQVALGFRPDGVVVARTEVAPRLFRDPLKREAFYRSAVDAVASIPGVEAASMGAPLPLEGGRFTQPFALSDAPGSPLRRAAKYVAWTGYFQTMGIRLIEGRTFTDDDRTGHRRVIVIDAALAQSLWAGRAATGARLWLDPKGATPGWAEIIGVVDHVHADTLRATGGPQMYLPYHLFPRTSMSLIVRSHASAAALGPELRKRVEALGGHRPVHAVLPLASYVADETADGRFALFVFAVLGAIGLTIGAAGLYGVLAYATSRRMHEIGVRMALGARPVGVFRMVAAQSVQATAIGIGLGAVAAALLTRSLQSLLFEVSPLDPWTFGGVALLLLLVAMAASYVPARRAVRVDPTIALKAE
jgi:putative ABC transport system permease protein